MHYKYASILYMIMVCFMYGMFIPLMFPITLLGIFNTYITEKIGLIWFYHKPPMYDESLGDRAFELLKRPPYLMFLMGYWVVGNRQIFQNSPVIKTFNNRPGDPQHPLWPEGSNQDLLCFLIFIIWFIRSFIYETINKGLVIPIRKYFECEVEELGIGDVTVNEKLPMFFKALMGNDQKAWYA